ncbi:MAG: hypothetical protein ACREMG_13075, partial [Gemmatimonadales bacterium]
MLLTLAFRHLWVRKLRSLFLLLGFAIGVGVMIVLLSVGQAMLEQSRDVSLVGGGEVTVLPQGIDVEAMRTGGLGGMFFGIDRARFLTRQGLGGPRHADLVRAVAPAIEGKLLYLCRNDRGRCAEPAVAVRAGGEIPSRAAALGAGLDVREGRWSDSPEDSAYVAPTLQQLYDDLDHFHLPRTSDSTWAEWHYFNLVTAPDEWWYITYLVGGEVALPPVRGTRWGGRLLVTHRRPDGGYQRYSADAPADRVTFDTARADVSIGDARVEQRNGRYAIRGELWGSGTPLSFDLVVQPGPNRWFPPVELREDEFLSGYVVPGLTAAATGRICLAGRCTRFEGVPAYHDHNWGVWRDVTWEWGAARGDRIALLYGGVYGPERSARNAGVITSPFFLTLVDSLGVRQVLRFARIRYQGAAPAAGDRRASAPERFALTATRDADSVRLSVEVEHALTTDMSVATFRRVFLQMRGQFRLDGRVGGEVVADSGMGFFETYVLPTVPAAASPPPTDTGTHRWSSSPRCWSPGRTPRSGCPSPTAVPAVPQRATRSGRRPAPRSAGPRGRRSDARSIGRRPA